MMNNKTIKIGILTSNGPRHIYFAKILCEHFQVVGLIMEPKNDYFEKQRQESAVVQEHFENLARYEKKYFGQAENLPKCQILSVQKKQVNDAATLEWMKQKNPEYILLFGTEILKQHWLDAFPQKIINMHLGLAPYYRGAATLFWPFVNDELEGVGVTFHIATAQVDQGAIIKRIKPKLDLGDNYYDITNKAIKQAIESLPQVLQEFYRRQISFKPLTLDHRYPVYKKKDFNEDVLEKVLSRYSRGLNEQELIRLRNSSRCPIN